MAFAGLTCASPALTWSSSCHSSETQSSCSEIAQLIVASMTKPRREAETEVRAWGFDHVFTWTDGPNAHYPPHKHSGVTTHLILNGSLTYTYPNDPEPTKETLGVGGRWDVDANKVHEVWVGKEGCTYVIGE